MDVARPRPSADVGDALVVDSDHGDTPGRLEIGRSYANVIGPSLRTTVLGIVMSNKRAIDSPKNQSDRQKAVLLIGCLARFDGNLDRLTYWIFSKYACLPRDFTIFLSKVYDFFETTAI